MYLDMTGMKDAAGMKDMAEAEDMKDNIRKEDK